MKKSTLSKIYTAIVTLAFMLGEIVVFITKGKTSTGAVSVLVGVLLAFVLAPTVHELGHILFAKSANMQVQYAKFFCFSAQRAGGRYELTLVNPLLADQAQVVPIGRGNMKNRAQKYVLGGLVFSGALVLVVAILAIVLEVLKMENALAFGILPYSAYLFFLNVAPFEYVDGKTDYAVYLGIKRGEPMEKAMLMAMQIQGGLTSGESYSSLPETLFDFPVLAEDEPMFLIAWDLKYRRALDCWDLEKASYCIKKMSQAEEYFTRSEREKFAVELTYLHALNGDFEKANESSKYCEEFLRSETATAKRVLATVALCAGRLEDAEILKESGKALLAEIEFDGERMLEENLLSRINTTDLHTLNTENDYGTNNE
jgi:hypothetical protein